MLVRKLYELNKITTSRPRDVATLFTLMEVPHEVRLNGVEMKLTCKKKDTLPVCRKHARVVNRARENELSCVVDENRSSVHGDDRVCGGGCVYERGGGESGEEVEEKEEDAP